MKINIALFVCMFFALSVTAQNDEGKFITPDRTKSYYFSTILKSIKAYQASKNDEERKKFVMDMSGKAFPTNIEAYRSIWHNKPVSQGRTGSCWCFSTISMLESDIYRQYNKKVKLSEMYIVYWEYVEKARGFVQSRGKSYFEEGSESNAVMRMMDIYGLVPLDVYTGLKKGQTFHDHSNLFSEMDTYLQNVKATAAWNEKQVIETIHSILNHHLGTPPEEFTVDGKEYTPKSYMLNYLKIKADDYVDILSYMQQPYNQQVEYEVPDNWWHSKEYYNVELDVFMRALKKAIADGYSVTIGGDVSESSFSREHQVAVVPSYDIPSKYINENARQFRFSNGTTTDDHGMHIVGMKETKDGNWFLVKDSGSGSRNAGKDSEIFGYYFFHEDYIKLKMMDFAVHKEAVQDVIKMME